MIIINSRKIASGGGEIFVLNFYTQKKQKMAKEKISVL